MTDTLWRMTWALPLVLVLGVLAIVVLKRVLRAVPSSDSPPMNLRQSLKLSDAAQLHLVALGGQSILVVETAAGTPAVHVLTGAPQVPAWPRLARKGRA